MDAKGMREILFRGKRLDNGEWVEGFYNHLPCGRFGTDEHMIQTVLENGKIGMLHDIDPSTVGQYTGMKDKNGKKVFEGDIVRKTNEGRHPEIFVANIRTCFYTIEEVYYSPFEHFTESCEYEIIGNMHDNLELLEDFNVEE